MWRFDTEETAGDRFADVVYWSASTVLFCFVFGRGRGLMGAWSSYEVQVEERVRGRGVGRALIELLERVGKAWGMEKVMLTVFKSAFPCSLFFRARERETMDADLTWPSLRSERRRVGAVQEGRVGDFLTKGVCEGNSW